MEEQQTKRFANIFLGACLLLIIGFFIYGFSITNKPTTNLDTSKTSATPTIMLTDYFSYRGQTGKSALDLLKEKASVGEAASGLVATINGRKADTSLHEYWAFYVNEKLANTGPAMYQTKDGDLIEWKIDKY